MALKVGGTEVITNARQLSNIASVDATTVTALGAAGVGGGGGIFDMTASGAISSGDLVALNSDGTVSAIAESVSPANPPTEVTTTSGFSSVEQHIETSYDTQYDRVVVAFNQSSNARAATYTVSGNKTNASATWSSDIAIQNKSVNYGPQLVYDSVNGKHIYAWSYYNSDSDDGGKVKVLDATNATLSQGTAVDWLPNLRSDQFDMCYDADNANIYISYQSDGGTTHIIAGSISGNSITLGSAVQLDTTKRNTACAYDPDTNQIVVLAQGPSKTKTYFLTVSGTTLTLLSNSSSNDLKNSSNSDIVTNYHNLMYEPHNNKLLASYYNQTDGGVYVSAGTITSNSISWGTPKLITSSNPDGLGSRGTKMTLKDTTSGDFYLIFELPTSPSIKIASLSLSGTTVSFTVSNLYEKTSTNGGDILYNPDITGNLLFTRRTSAGSLRVQTLNTDTTTSNNTDWIGIAGEAISDTASGEIKLLGSVDSQQSGLTPKTNYYAQSDGSLGTSSADSAPLVGKALTSTSILITRPD